VILVWKKRLRTWSRALQEEHRVKALTRARKEALLSVAAALSDTRSAQRKRKRLSVYVAKR